MNIIFNYKYNNNNNFINNLSIFLFININF